MFYLTVFSSSDLSRGYDHYDGHDRGGRGGYDRGGRGGYGRGGRGGYADDRFYGRFGHRPGAGYQNGISGMLVVANYLGSFFLIPIIPFYA